MSDSTIDDNAASQELDVRTSLKEEIAYRVEKGWFEEEYAGFVQRTALLMADATDRGYSFSQLVIGAEEVMQSEVPGYEGDFVTGGDTSAWDPGPRGVHFALSLVDIRKARFLDARLRTLSDAALQQGLDWAMDSDRVGSWLHGLIESLAEEMIQEATWRLEAEQDHNTPQVESPADDPS